MRVFKVAEMDAAADGMIDTPSGGLDRPTPITDAVVTGAVIRA